MQALNLYNILYTIFYIYTPGVFVFFLQKCISWSKLAREIPKLEYIAELIPGFHDNPQILTELAISSLIGRVENHKKFHCVYSLRFLRGSILYDYGYLAQQSKFYFSDIVSQLHIEFSVVSVSAKPNLISIRPMTHQDFSKLYFAPIEMKSYGIPCTKAVFSFPLFPLLSCLYLIQTWLVYSTIQFLQYSKDLKLIALQFLQVYSYTYYSLPLTYYMRTSELFLICTILKTTCKAPHSFYKSHRR